MRTKFHLVPIGGTFSSVAPPLGLWMKTQVIHLNGVGSEKNAVKICLTREEPGQAEFRQFADDELVYYS